MGREQLTRGAGSAAWTDSRARANRRHAPRRARCTRGGAAGVCVGLAFAACAGCATFTERSFPLSRQDVVSIGESGARSAEPPDTRAWLRAAHSKLAPLLPPSYGTPLLSEDLTDADGRPRSVWKHFDYTPASITRIVDNFSGMRCTAQCGSVARAIDAPPPAWNGFEDIWIPIDDSLSLSGRLGLALDEQGKPRDADCIVILAGMFGDNGVARCRELAIGLRDCGYHALALEPRGHGQTELHYPDKAYMFGILEADDLLVVSDWLKRRPHVRRTGLIGFCWGGNLALLAAWLDGAAADDPDMAPALRERYFRARASAVPRYDAGMIVMSAVIRWEDLIDELDQPQSICLHPPEWAVQGTMRDRMVRKSYPNPDGSLRRLITFEFNRSGLDLPNGEADGYRFLRLLPYKDRPASPKLECVRTPLLVVHGANDPLVPVQDVVDLMAPLRNPLVATLLLPDGGHVGFAAHAREHYFSLIVNFFDPRNGAAAMGKGAGQVAGGVRDKPDVRRRRPSRVAWAFAR